MLYVLLQNNTTVTPRLSGYGVRLDIKSTEYKAVDDSKVSSGELLVLHARQV